MKLTKSRLKQIIKEELSQLKEFGPPVDPPDPGEWTDPPAEEDREITPEDEEAMRATRQEQISKLKLELKDAVLRKHQIESELLKLGVSHEEVMAPDSDPF